VAKDDPSAVGSENRYSEERNGLRACLGGSLSVGVSARESCVTGNILGGCEGLVEGENGLRRGRPLTLSVRL